jgi:CDP-glycerol glycerophosphotransferase (TagB/SpsB family)
MWTCATADHVAVNGTQLEELLHRRGFARDRLSIVGQPRYDGFNAAAALAIRDEARARLGLEADRFAVMFATQPNQDASYVRCVAEAILAVDDVRLLLRPHPSTPPRASEALARIAADERVLPVSTGRIFDLIAASDLVVVQNSTVALEAALLGRPVITANLTGMPDVVPYAALGVSVEAKDAATVTELIERARDGALPTSATDERTRAGIHYLVGPTDGGAAARVADLIDTLLAQRAHR